MNDPVVECVGVGVERGGVRVVSDVALTVRAGEWVAVVGPNGAGKTSLMHAMAGLIPAIGHLRVGGLDPAHAPRRRMARVAALMPQRPVVPEGISVRELVGLGRTPHLRRFGTETAADRDAVERTLARLELSELADRPARVPRLAGDVDHRLPGPVGDRGERVVLVAVRAHQLRALGGRGRAPRHAGHGVAAAQRLPRDLPAQPAGAAQDQDLHTLT